MAAFWAVFTFGGSGPALTAHGSLDLKQEIQIQIRVFWSSYCECYSFSRCHKNVRILVVTLNVTAIELMSDYFTLIISLLVEISPVTLHVTAFSEP
jgi:hypothetical protein